MVVAVEANPSLAEELVKQYAGFIKSGQLRILNKCITPPADQHQEVDFYIHRYHSGLSRFPVPEQHIEDYTKIRVSSISYQQLIDQFGLPDLVKIDLEGADLLILQSILESSVIPAYVSVENWGRPVLEALLSHPGFHYYNLVSFYNFSSIYGYSGIDTAGPFGTDIKSPWLNRSAISAVYNQMPDPWFDIHASSIAFETGQPDLRFYAKRFNLALLLKSLFPHRLKSRIKDLIGFRR